MFIPYIIFQILFDTCPGDTQKKYKNLYIISKITCKDASALGMCNLQYVKQMFYHIVFSHNSTLLAKKKKFTFTYIKK